MDVSSDVKNIKGIGPARAKLLSKLGIYTIRDVLFYFPRDYQDMSPLTFKQGTEDETGVFPCIVTGSAVSRKTRTGIYITKLPITDGQNKGYAVFFNQPFVEKSFYPNQRLLLIGKIKKNFGIYEIASPEWIKFDKGSNAKIERIRPIYPLSKGISQNFVRNTVKNAIEKFSGLEETLPNDILSRYNLLSLEEAIKNIHFPQNFRMLEKARERFIFEELLLFQLGVNLSRYYLKSEKRKNRYNTIDLGPFLSEIPFTLTSGQEKVLKDIIKDLKSEYIMSRLIQGDVGSGKTVVACAALYLSAKNGFQGVMMAPTEILAEQHYNILKRFLSPFDINVDMLKGGLAKKERKKLLLKLKNGTVDVLVGTHAIIQEDVEFKKLGMIITDEQHRFGVKQRENLVKKGHCPDVIVMSATPIPRTIAMALYSDLDISVIDTLPAGRQKVDTYVVNDSMRKRVYDFMASEVKKGHLVYVVCPAVEENELEIINVEQHTAYLRQEYPYLQIGMLHGKMKQDEKDKMLNRFLLKKIQVLVATTVVEVGVDVPLATLMIIENAERFGLAQLHQLRGRVGRSSLKSYCILISGSNQGTARERLNYLMNCYDGFKISQKDLELRGPGEFLGVKQHGFFEFKFASFIDNIEILKTTQKLANQILEKKYLLLPEYKNLKKSLETKICI
ncbi:ATP-dependent DNA helicase RecG [Tepidanaerobacter acetatoxydans]|uniref:ATP-dependent DNA helicase RecG n=1 Tax=Tepidanaerobacter acetatoxydans TaxID=499229 RepID=UPI001BD3F780|nr:ATP-dependent DNA helicase RecG [Tepidanaerobacter acetatoxydans]